MRKHPTEAEALLWKHIRKQQLKGLRFRRQHVIGQFIVDFYCHESQTVIEIDGGIHQAQKANDYEREKWLRAMGFKIVRFTNTEVINDLENVLGKIGKICSIEKR